MQKLSIAEIETLVLNKLKASITDRKIEAFPDDIDKYLNSFANNVILVNYLKSDYTQPAAANKLLQNRIVHFQITIMNKNLRATDSKSAGLYDELETVTVALSGFEMLGFKRMYPVEDKFLNKDQNIWKYAVIFAAERKLN